MACLLFFKCPQINWYLPSFPLQCVPNVVLSFYVAFTVQNLWTQLIVQVRATLLVLKLSPLFLGKNK